MKTLSIQWHYFGRNKHAIIEYRGVEFVQAIPIAKRVAELLVDKGMNSGS
jgi:hypothetical protein